MHSREVLSPSGLASLQFHSWPSGGSVSPALPSWGQPRPGLLFSLPARACCLAGSLINHVHYPFVIVNLLNRQHYSCSNGWRSPTKKLGAWRHSFNSLYPRDFDHGEAILFDTLVVDFWVICLALSLVSYYLFSLLCKLFHYVFVMIFFFFFYIRAN